MSAADRDPGRRAAAARSGSTAVDREVATPRLLSADEAAAFLGKSRAAFYIWRKRHHIPNRIVGRGLRFLLDDLVIASAPAPRPLEDATSREQWQALARAHARREAVRH